MFTTQEEQTQGNSKLTHSILVSATVAGVVALFGFGHVKAVEAATPVDANGQTTVEAGDTYSSVADNFGVSLAALMQANADHPDYNVIYPGDKITVPQAAVSQPQSQVQPQSQSQDSQVVSQAPQAPQASQSQTSESAAPEQQPVSQAQAPVSSDGEQSAKDWIASRESGGSYGAQNGRYVGRYQLDSSYLNGDYSEANQEAVANNYVASRYGSWQAAQAFWQANGWY